MFLDWVSENKLSAFRVFTFLFVFVGAITFFNPLLLLFLASNTLFHFLLGVPQITAALLTAAIATTAIFVAATAVSFLVDCITHVLTSLANRFNIGHAQTGPQSEVVITGPFERNNTNTGLAPEPQYATTYEGMNSRFANLHCTHNKSHSIEEESKVDDAAHEKDDNSKKDNSKEDPSAYLKIDNPNKEELRVEEIDNEEQELAEKQPNSPSM